jgi:hypothetical protein
MPCVRGRQANRKIRMSLGLLMSCAVSHGETRQIAVPEFTRLSWVTDTRRLKCLAGKPVAVALVLSQK